MTDKQQAAFLDTEEGKRLVATRTDPAWRRWGPYLSDRQWGTVREDYSAGGDAWDSLPHDHARSRAYRWGEDGIGGFGDDRLHWCLSLALWNGNDPILKERLFGLTNAEGNHGEDVKELYYYLDGVPTHSYMRMLYKYPHAAFPYERLLEENRRRSRHDPEFELLDTGLFDAGRYFDVEIVYAKAAADDILMRVAVTNRGPETATLTVLPQLWARNSWSWYKEQVRPSITATGARAVKAVHPRVTPMLLSFETAGELLFCDNDTNTIRLYGEGEAGYFKDAFDDRIVHDRLDAVNPLHAGTKCGGLHQLSIGPGQTEIVRVRFATTEGASAPFADFDAVVARRAGEADAFYAAIQDGIAHPDARAVQRQAFAGMLWSKQLYYYDVREWLDGDVFGPKPPASRRDGRNADWEHFRATQIMSMPDAWEYPWFASWDLALQCLVFAAIDPEFAKEQLLMLLHEWYMHPNAALPAYEWSFSDANPPLHAWAAWRVFEADRAITGTPDHEFLRRIFRKLTMNFTWWVNRKDESGRNIFQGGFLGLDNIGLFDRSAPLPMGGTLSQSDGTAWMAMYALDMLRIATELALLDHTYEDMATKFFEHFLSIAKAAASSGGLWDEEDKFFYDVLNTADGQEIPIRTRTMVGLIPIFAVAVLASADIDHLPQFADRMDWLLRHRPDLARLVSRWNEPGRGETLLLSLLRGHRLKKLLSRMLDPDEFLSDYGVRAVSKVHGAAPYHFDWAGQRFDLAYEPGESTTGLFGGNSNWRGPIWMPVNYMLIKSLRHFNRYYGPDFRVDLPYAPGTTGTLGDIADELSNRLSKLFMRGADQRRPVHGDNELAQADPHFRDHLLFYEYFHGDNGRGVGASHQTGWTGLIALLIADTARSGPGPSPAAF